MTDKESTLGCGIEFPHFGASYPDAICIDGYLYDMDSYESDLCGFTIGGDDPCPVCNKDKWLESVMEMEVFDTEADALAYRDTLIDKYLD